MSRDEVPAEVYCAPMQNGKPGPRRFVIKFEDAEMDDEVFDDEKQAREAWAFRNENWNCHLFATVPLAARPAAPATDAEGERLREAAATVLEWYDRDGSVGTADEAMEPLREALARPAPAPQAVEEVRREAAEDERDRLYAAADAEIEVFASFASKEVRRFLWQMGAMLPADRQRARAGQDGGA